MILNVFKTKTKSTSIGNNKIGKLVVIFVWSESVSNDEQSLKKLALCPYS